MAAPMYPATKGFCVKTFGIRTPAFPWTPIHLKSGHSSNKNLSQYPLSSAMEVKEIFIILGMHKHLKLINMF